jgi:hypothetical protein
MKHLDSYVFEPTSKIKVEEPKTIFFTPLVPIECISFNVTITKDSIKFKNRLKMSL